MFGTLKLIFAKNEALAILCVGDVEAESPFLSRLFFFPQKSLCFSVDPHQQ